MLSHCENEYLQDRFAIVDKTHRLYQAKRWMGDRTKFPGVPLAVRRPSVPQAGSNAHLSHMTSYMESSAILEEQHQRAIESYGPPSVIVNERYSVLHVSETAGRYLRLPKGPITGDLLSLLLPELQLEVHTSLFQAFEKGKATVSKRKIQPPIWLTGRIRRIPLVCHISLFRPIRG